MPSFNVTPDGRLVDDNGNPAPQKYQDSWNEFQNEKAPVSMAPQLQKEANDEARAKGEPLPFPEQGGGDPNAGPDPHGNGGAGGDPNDPQGAAGDPNAEEDERGPEGDKMPGPGDLPNYTMWGQVLKRFG